MAKDLTPEAQAEKNRIRGEKKQLKKEKKEQRREVKRRAKEIARQEEALGDEEGNSFVTFAATLFIVLLWLAVVCVIVKLDVGGFGSSVLAPILKDVPVLNHILPKSALTQTDNPEEYGGYSSLSEAVDYIKQLELEIERLQTASKSKDNDIAQLQAQVQRLKPFEEAQVEFQRIQEAFGEQVIYNEKSPGPEEYKKWYEALDPATAESLYKQVVIQLKESEAFGEYASAYALMKPKEAADLLEQMTSDSDMKLAARILEAMDATARADILNEIDPEFGARLTKIMDPDS